MSLMPFITIPLRFVIAAFLITLIFPFMVVYIAFQPRDGWKDLVFLLMDGRDFILEGKNDRILNNED